MFGAKESFTSTGTGDLTGLTEVTGFTTTEEAAPSSIGSRVGYSITDADGLPLEKGVGYKSGATTWVREHVIWTMSSGTFGSANSALSLAAGTKYLLLHTDPADAAPPLPPRPCSALAADDRLVLPSNVVELSAIGLTPSNYNRGIFALVRFDFPGRVNGFVVHSSSTQQLDIALYTVNASTGKPGSIYIGVANHALTGAGKTVIAFTEQRMVPGYYYLYLNVNNGSSFTGREMIVSPGGLFIPHSAGGLTEQGVIYQAQTQGTLPTAPNPTSVGSFTGSTGNNGKLPFVALRAVGA